MQNVIERILNLLAFLLTVDRPVTADEIRHTVAGYGQENDEAWRRMFERDKDLLRSLGIPLEMRPTDAWEVEHGYVIPREDYSLPDPALTDAIVGGGAFGGAYSALVAQNMFDADHTEAIEDAKRLVEIESVGPVRGWCAFRS